MTRKTLTSQKLGILLETATTTISLPETQRRGKSWLLCLRKVPLFQVKPGFSLLMMSGARVISAIWLLQCSPQCLMKRNELIPSPSCMSIFPVADAGQKVHLWTHFSLYQELSVSSSHHWFKSVEKFRHFTFTAEQVNSTSCGSV